MPIYEYRCGSCGHELEAMQKFSDPVLTDCPQCRDGALVKLVSAAGFQLKGGGWYATDFRSNGSGKAKSKDSGDAKPEGSESKSETKTDAPAKPAGCGGGCSCH